MMGTLGAELTLPPTFLNPRQIEELPVSDCGGAVVSGREIKVSAEDAIVRANAILDAAIDRARQDADRAPRSVRARSNLGVALVNRGRLDEAAQEFERALELEPQNSAATAGLARVRLAQERFEDAQALNANLATMRPSDPMPVVGLATVALHRNDLEQAVRLFEAALKLAPKSLIPRFHLGMSLLGLGRTHEAIAQLREATRSNPRLALLRVGLGNAYARAGDRARAIQEFQIAIHLVPGMVEAIHGLARVFVEDGATASAIAVLEDLLSQDSADCEARELLAWAYFRSQSYKRARAELNKIIVAIDHLNGEGMADQARLLNNLGACLWRLRNLDDARRQFDRSINLEPGVSIPYHNLGRLLLSEGRADAALPVLSKCNARFPGDVTSRLLLVSALDMLDRHDEAISLLTPWVRTGNAPERAWAVLGYLITDRKRDPATAVEILTEAREQFPGDPIIANNLAYALLTRGDHSAARIVLESLPRGTEEKVESDIRVVLCATWGLLHLMEGDLDAAEQGYRLAETIALQLGDRSLTAATRRKRHLEFARAYLRAGNMEATRREVRHGLGVVGEDPHRYRRDLEELAIELSKLRKANPASGSTQ